MSRWAEAVLVWDQVLELDGGKNGLDIRIQRAKALARKNDSIKAWSEIQTISSDVNLTKDQQFNLACATARLFESSKDNVHADFAINLLKKASPKKSTVAADDDLASLRSRSDYQEWLAGLEPSQ